MELLLSALEPLTWALIFLGVVQNLVLLVQLPAAYRELQSQSQLLEAESSWQLITSEAIPSVSIVVPAYNEEAAISDVVQSMLRLRYSAFEVIVVNDGSKDATLANLIKEFELQETMRPWTIQVPCAAIRGAYGNPKYPNLLVVDKEPGGCKADASNAGINFAKNDLICVIDADSLLEPDSLVRAARPFMEDKRMVAVGGTIRILNGCRIEDGRVVEYGLPERWLPLLQVMEYQRAFLGARLALSRWRMLTLISGAFSLFKRDIAVACGGFGTDTVGEDYDLVMKMHRYLIDNEISYSMRYLADTVCWTEAPFDLKGLAVQRRRWQLGGLQVFKKHREMLFARRYGRIGMVALPLALIVDVLGPIGELLGLILLIVQVTLGTIDGLNAFLLAGIVILIGVLCTYITLVFEQTSSRWRLGPRQQGILLLAAMAESLGYRQLNGWWRLQAGWMFITKRSSWGSIVRLKRG